MRILLTGFKGFIGKNVHKTLLEKYDNIISLCCIEKDYITDQFWPTRLSRAVIDIEASPVYSIISFSLVASI